MSWVDFGRYEGDFGDSCLLNCLNGGAMGDKGTLSWHKTAVNNPGYADKGKVVVSNKGSGAVKGLQP